MSLESLDHFVLDGFLSEIIWVYPDELDGITCSTCIPCSFIILQIREWTFAVGIRVELSSFLTKIELVYLYHS